MKINQIVTMKSKDQYIVEIESILQEYISNQRLYAFLNPSNKTISIMDFVNRIRHVYSYITETEAQEYSTGVELLKDIINVSKLNVI